MTLCVITVVAVWVRSPGLAKVLFFVHMVGVILGFIFLIALIISVSLGMRKTAEGSRMVTSIILTSVSVLVCITMLIHYLLISVFKSLAKIFNVGATGFEGKNYKEIEMEKQFDGFAIPMCTSGDVISTGNGPR